MESHESTSARPRFSCSGSPLGVVSTTPIPSNQNGPSMALTASCPFEASRPHPVGPLGPADNIPIDGMPEANGSLPKSRKFTKESNIGQQSYRVCGVSCNIVQATDSTGLSGRLPLEVRGRKRV